MTTEEPVTPDPSPPPPAPTPPPVETTTKPVSTANTLNVITILQILTASALAFLGVVQASSSVFGAERSGIAMMLCGGLIAALQAASSVINTMSSSKVQG